MNASESSGSAFRRRQQASTTASSAPAPSASSVGEPTIRDRVLRRQADQYHQPDLDEYVVVAAHQSPRRSR